MKTGSRNTSTSSSTATAITIPTDFESGRLEVRKVRGAGVAGVAGVLPKSRDDSGAQQRHLPVSV